MEKQSKIAIVTGGSRELGKEMSLSLAEKGIDVVLTYHVNQQAAVEVVSQVQSLGRKAVALQLDTSKPKQFEGFFTILFKYLEQEYGNCII